MHWSCQDIVFNYWSSLVLTAGQPDRSLKMCLFLTFLIWTQGPLFCLRQQIFSLHDATLWTCSLSLNSLLLEDRISVVLTLMRNQYPRDDNIVSDNHWYSWSHDNAELHLLQSWVFLSSNVYEHAKMRTTSNDSSLSVWRPLMWWYLVAVIILYKFYRSVQQVSSMYFCLCYSCVVSDRIYSQGVQHSDVPVDNHRFSYQCLSLRVSL